MTAPPIKRFTPAEYYRLEREAEYKSDYYQGEIFAMAGGTIRHSTICTNLSGDGLDESITVPGINVRLPLSKIYDGVDFTEAGSA